MPELTERVTLIECRSCNHRVMLRAPHEEALKRGLARRQFRYVKKLARKFGAELVDDRPDRCSKCGLVISEPAEERRTVTRAGASLDEIKTHVEGFLND